MMGWIVRARPAQPHGHGMTSSSVVVAVEVAPAGRQGQQQAHQNGGNQYSGDDSHIQAIGSQEWGNSIASQVEDVNRFFARHRAKKEGGFPSPLSIQAIHRA
jgi:hypothetical protein